MSGVHQMPAAGPGKDCPDFGPLTNQWLVYKTLSQSLGGGIAERLRRCGSTVTVPTAAQVRRSAEASIR